MSKTFFPGGHLVAALLVACAVPLSAQVTPLPQASSPEVRRLTVDQAVQIALENNLGVQIARIDPLVQDLAVAQARGVPLVTWDQEVVARASTVVTVLQPS